MDTLKRSRASWAMIDQLKADHIRETLTRAHQEQEKRKALLAGLTEVARIAEVRANGLGALTAPEAFRQLGALAREAIAAAADAEYAPVPIAADQPDQTESWKV